MHFAKGIIGKKTDPTTKSEQRMEYGITFDFMMKIANEINQSNSVSWL